MNSTPLLHGSQDLPLWAGAKAHRLHELALWPRLGEFQIAPGYVFLAESFSKKIYSMHNKVVGKGPFIIRSSASLEDADQKSHAGLFRSTLICNFKDMEQAVASLRDHAAIIASCQFALLVQPFIQMRCSGVAFSRGPGMPRGVALISAAYGQCSGVTAGVSSTENYILELASGQILSTHKEQPRIAVHWDAATGQERSVAIDTEFGPVVELKILKSLSRLLKDLEVLMKKPIDIEWGIGPDDTLWLLQVRPCPDSNDAWTTDRLTPRAMRRNEAQKVGWSIPKRWLVANEMLINFRDIVAEKGKMYTAQRFGDDDGILLEEACVSVEADENFSGMWVVEEFLDLDAGGLCETTPDGVIIEYGTSPLVGELTRGWITAHRILVNPETGKTQDPVPPPWPPQLLIRLARLTFATHSILGSGPIEWGSVDQKLYFLDMTTTFRSIPRNARVIQPGNASGPAHIIELQDDKQDIMVPCAHVYSLKVKKGPPPDRIIIARRPSMELVPWIGKAAGFVFEEGSQLAHLCVLIMEHEVPAIIAPEVARLVREGQYVNIEGTQAKILVNCHD